MEMTFKISIYAWRKFSDNVKEEGGGGSGL